MMKNIDDLLKQLDASQHPEMTSAGGNYFDILNFRADQHKKQAATAIRAQQAENERLKGEYARGIKDAAKWHDKEIVEITSQLDRGIANSDGEIQMVMERIFHKRVATEIRALIPKQKEGE